MYFMQDASALVHATDAQVAGQLGRDRPEGYRPDPGLVDAVNVALVLNRPLLLTGEPGTGKTQLAYSVAWQLARQRVLNVTSPRVEKFEAKSTSIARDLFYSFDTLARFQAAYSHGSSNNLDYITYNALGRALLQAMPRDAIADSLPADFDHQGPTRCVVLIDEIDKAPRDFPNDLLNEIDQTYFRVAELNNRRIGGPGMLTDEFRPLIFITSNSEKNLPDPFLRRCIYYNIPFPSEDELRDILLSRIAQLQSTGGRLGEEALAFFYHLRNDDVVRRRISPAELIQWLVYMLSRGAKPQDSLLAAKPLALSGLSALTKDPEDQDRVRADLNSRLASH